MSLLCCLVGYLSHTLRHVQLLSSPYEEPKRGEVVLYSQLQMWYSDQSLAEPPRHQSELRVARGAKVLSRSVQHEGRLQRAGRNQIEMHLLCWYYYCCILLGLWCFCLVLHRYGLVTTIDVLSLATRLHPRCVPCHARQTGTRPVKPLCPAPPQPLQKTSLVKVMSTRVQLQNMLVLDCRTCPIAD
jgi:hypothetical protein